MVKLPGGRDGNLRRIRSGGEKGFVICRHDLYRSNAEMMKQIKQKKKLPAVGGLNLTALGCGVTTPTHL